VRVASRKNANGEVLRRDQMLIERTRAAPLRTAFPEVGQLSIELHFSDQTARTPSPQVHTLFPAAPAFFRFACPCTDCDGDFDLADAIKALLQSAAWRKRTAASSSSTLACQGVRMRDRAGSRPCTMQLKFNIAATHAST
jgi:hypothetical protein